jgi:hypothetical protein
MDKEAVDLGRIEFECAFEGSDDGVDAGHGEIVGKRAVAGDLDVVGLLVGSRMLRVGGGVERDGPA